MSLCRASAAFDHWLLTSSFLIFYLDFDLFSRKGPIDFDVCCASALHVSSRTVRASNKASALSIVIVRRRTIESRKPPPESCASRSETCGDKKFWRPRPKKKLRSLTPRSKLLNIPQTAMNSRAPSVTAASTRRSMTRAPRTREHPHPSQSLQHRSRLQLLLVSPSFFFACETMGRSATHTDRLSCSPTFPCHCLARCSFVSQQLPHRVPLRLRRRAILSPRTIS